MSWLSRLLGTDDNDGDNTAQDAIEDLLTWEEENDALLPGGMSAEDIAELEERGYVVNLETGEIMTEAEANGYEVNL